MTKCRRQQAVLLTATLVLLTACGIDKVLSQNEQFIGEWRLSSFNGRSIPATVYDDGFQQLVADSVFLSIRENKTWYQELFLRTVFQGRVIQRHNLSDFGTYTVESATIRLTSGDSGEIVTGRIEQSGLTFNIREDGESNRWVFRRR